MFTPITSPPKFVTPEEHAQITSSTPDSFFGIPPTLRFHNVDVEVEIEPKLDFLPNGNVKGTIWVTDE
jgi:nucleotide-sensitive chloride channel 1A